MQLSLFTDYSLRVLIYLAYKQGEMATVNEITAAYGLSKGHLMKVVHQLGRDGYITTQRGKGGGLWLAREPATINIGDVVRHTEETLNIISCLNPSGTDDCLLFRHCRLKGVLNDAHKLFMAHLDQFTLADMLQGPSPFIMVDTPVLAVNR